MKTWTTPQLIVLVRGKPEEAVLQFCKSGNPLSALMGPAATPSNSYASCSSVPPSPGLAVNGCLDCATIASS
jgi:hypothetical protein